MVYFGYFCVTDRSVGHIKHLYDFEIGPPQRQCVCVWGGSLSTKLKTNFAIWLGPFGRVIYDLNIEIV